VAGGVSFRLCEIEFYLNGGVHTDFFTHSDQQQLTYGQWYFHKTGPKYRTGNYKGLDITFATGNVYGGILIRAIEEIKTSKVYDGPCVSVNRIFSIFGCSEVGLFVQKEGFDWNCLNPDSILFLREKPDLKRRVLYKCPRVGLTLNKTNGSRSTDIGRDYRYLSAPKEIKKGRANLIVGLHKNGKDAAYIAHLTSTPIQVVNDYIQWFEEGKNEDSHKQTEVNRKIRM